MKLLNIRIPNQRFPTLIIQMYFLMIAITFTYLYYHKFIQEADFYSKLSPGGLYAVANFESVKPIQYRILLPFIFKGLAMLHIIPDKPLFFLINVTQAYLILLSFYFLLNRHFQSKAMNCWLAPVIIYPMLWNLIIMNGQFFYMDFGLLLFMILGYYFIVTRHENWLLLTFFFGYLNHTAVTYLVISYLLFNYDRLFRLKTVFYAGAMTAIFFAIPTVINLFLPPSATGHFLINNFPRNMGLFVNHPAHLLVRDFFFNFGGLHFFVLLFLVTGVWKKFKGPYLYIHIMIIPFFISLLMTFSLEEMRNYVAIIPNIIILCLFFLSTFPNSFLRPQEYLLKEGNKA